MDRPLTGVRVVEMSTFVAGPVTARLLADLGADVIKVEAPTGDGWRVTGVGFCAKRFSAKENPVFDIYNTGKRLVSLNLKAPEGKEAFMKLISECDVFVTNLRPAALRRLGISYEEMKELFPRLIYAVVLGYGEQGPDSHKPAFDTTAFWARSGFFRDMSPNHELYQPVHAPASVGDTATGYLLMGEICAALYRRERTGLGDYVTSTLYHNGVFCMGTMAIIAQEPFGNTYPRTRLEVGVPGGSYKCADDEWVFIALGNAAVNLPKLHKLAGIENDPRFLTWPDRSKNRSEYYAAFRDMFLTKTADEWVAIADELDIPLVRMAHFKDVTKDPQAWENGFLEHVTFENGNVDVMPSSPIEMQSVGKLKTTTAPAVGKHTVEVLKSLGYTDAQIDAMIAAGAAVTAE